MARGGDIALREFLDDTNTPGKPVASAVRHDLRLLWTALPPEELRRIGCPLPLPDGRLL
jgi:hypothetical protein